MKAATMLISAVLITTWIDAKADQEGFDHAKNLLCGNSIEKNGGFMLHRDIHEGNFSLLAYFNQERPKKYTNKNLFNVRIEENGLFDGGMVTDCRTTGAINLKRDVSSWYGNLRLTGCKAPWLDGDYMVRIRQRCDSYEWNWEKNKPHRIVGKAVTRVRKN